MQGWQTSYLGLRDMPGDLSEFELQALFSFSRAELDLITLRRSDSLKLGLALHIGFARMTGRPLSSVRMVHPPCSATLAESWTSPPRIWCLCALCMPVDAPCPTTSTKPATAWDSSG